MLDTVKIPVEKLRGEIVQAADGSETLERNPGVSKVEAGIAFAAATAATFLTRETLEASWRKSTGNAPPKNPASHTISWKEALLWGAISGAVIGAARIASRRAAAAAYRAR